MNPDERELKDQRIHLTPKHYVTISFLVLLVTMIITATYNVINYSQVNPLQQELQKYKKQVDDQAAENDIFKNELEKLQAAYKRLLDRDENPVTMEPLDGDTVIGGMVNFKWDYKYHKKYQRYILDIRCISDLKRIITKLDVLTPKEKQTNLPTNYIGNGEFIWRVIPGYILNDEEVIQGTASNYSSFTIYKSTLDRIKATKILRVGTTPSFRGSFTFVGKDGKIEGFDISLIEWILPKLKGELKIDGNIEYKITKLPWSDLLPSLAKHEIDLVISAMTSTKGREDSNPGVKFTEGYYQSHQIFISLRDGRNFAQSLEDLKQLKGKKVGVFAGTTNEQAAHFLRKKYGFTVDNMYKSQDDLISGLQNNKIDFALMDDVLAKIGHGMKFHQVGPKLDILLGDFYWEKLGRANEKYAITVVDEPLTSPNLLTLINEMLKSPEGQEKLQELAQKWIK